VKGEMQAKTTYQKSAKGPVAISEVGAEGKYITLDNTGRKEENCEGWKLRRNVDNRDIPEFTLDHRFSNLRPGAKITIWAKGQKPSTAPAGDLECNHETWGIGAQATTKLVNQDGDDKTTHVMKTVYSS